MTKPVIRSGKFSAGADLRCGENVVVDVAEEVVVGDRCVLPDNAYLSGRRVEIGDDFYGYSWGHPDSGAVNGAHPGSILPTSPIGSWLEVGRGRRDEEDAILWVGSRCTFHNNRIDLACAVTIGDDVGLSPDAVIYTHGYWQSILEGHPWRFAPVTVEDGVIVGFRSVLLAGSYVRHGTVVGAQSVVSGTLNSGSVYAGNPVRCLSQITVPSESDRRNLIWEAVLDYQGSRSYRRLQDVALRVEYPRIVAAWFSIDCATRTLTGDEDADTDDLRWFLFTRGIRVYTKRPFTKLGRQP